MLLAVDIGNSNTNLALFDNEGNKQHRWRLATNHSDRADTLNAHVYTFFAMSGIPAEVVTNVAIACVVPVLLGRWIVALKRMFGVEPLVIGPNIDFGVKLDVLEPQAVGADRIANCVEAIACYGAPVIVVDFGTATNLDVIDHTGAFRGGPILPGVQLSAQALFDRAAMLSNVPLALPSNVIGNTTESAVQSGLVLGAAAQIEGLVWRIQEALAAEGDDIEPATVVATGGFSSLMEQATDLLDAVDKDLTLRGIYHAWKYVQ